MLPKKLPLLIDVTFPLGFVIGPLGPMTKLLFCKPAQGQTAGRVHRAAPLPLPRQAASMAEGSVPDVVGGFVKSIIAKVLAAEHAGQPTQPGPAATPLSGQAATPELEQALAPSPASALANALAELALQTPLPKRLPSQPNGSPAAASAAASTATPAAEVVAGEPGVLAIALPAAARSEDLSVGLCYDKIMEQHLGPPGAACASLSVLRRL